MDAYTASERVKIYKALQVHQLRLINPNMTQAQACARVGIDSKTYRKWIATQEEVLKLFEQTKVEQERIEYADCLVSKAVISHEFIQDAMKPGASIPERVKALEYIDEKIDKYASRYHTVDVEAEQDLLSGPILKPGISRMANRSSK